MTEEDKPAIAVIEKDETDGGIIQQEEDVPFEDENIIDESSQIYDEEVNDMVDYDETIEEDY